MADHAILQRAQREEVRRDGGADLKSAETPSDAGLIDDARRFDKVKVPYNIEKGDTFYSIARKYGSSVQEIQELNKGIDPRSLEINTRILIYKNVPITPESVPTESYYIKAGDTFSSIAKEIGIGVGEIQVLNPGVRPTKLKVGQRILLPLSEQKTSGQVFPAGKVDPTGLEGTPPVDANAAEIAGALNTLYSYAEKVSGEGRKFVISQNSRPFPQGLQALHTLLNAAGAVKHLSGTEFTADTYEAVRNFQNSRSIVPDGKVGEGTLEALKVAVSGEIRSQQEFAALSTAKTEDLLDPVRKGEVILRWAQDYDGKNGNREAYLSKPRDPKEVAMIRNLQNLLNEAGAWPVLECHGVFDSKTHAAVKNFQKSQQRIAKIGIDGAVGSETMKYLDGSRDKFLFALGKVLQSEGGVSNNPNDRGGLTNMGVTQRTYDEWRDKHGLKIRKVTQIDPLEAKALYRELYWQTANCDLYSPKIATVVFDTAVLCGPGKAREHVREACRSLKVSANEIETEAEVIKKAFGNKLIDLREEHHKSDIEKHPEQKEFKRGWENRTARLRAMVMERTREG